MNTTGHALQRVLELVRNPLQTTDCLPNLFEPFQAPRYDDEVKTSLGQFLRKIDPDAATGSCHKSIS